MFFIKAKRPTRVTEFLDFQNTFAHLKVTIAHLQHCNTVSRTQLRTQWSGENCVYWMGGWGASHQSVRNSGCWDLFFETEDV